MGYCDHFCLSVCLSVCHFVRKHDNSRTNHPILIKFGQIVYNHNRKVKFENGLCPLIFKATAVKKTVRNEENQPLQVIFNILMSKLHSRCKTEQSKRYQSPVAMVTKMSVKNRYFFKNCSILMKFSILVQFLGLNKNMYKVFKISNI